MAILKLYIPPGGFRSRLIRELESRPGPYKFLNPKAAGSKRLEDPSSAAIRYGRVWVSDPEKSSEHVLNRNALRFHTLSAEKKEHRLKASGLSASLAGATGISHRKFRRMFAVTAFHLQALTAVPVQTGRGLPGGEAEPDRASTVWKRLERTAVRALYALGLDFGEVVIAAGEEGSFTVEGISAVPEIGVSRAVPAVAAAMSAILSEFEANHEGRRELLLGMDPEFLLVNDTTGKVVPASRFLSHKGLAGCDVLRYRGQRMFPLAELRPMPGGEPREVLRHLLLAFRAAREAIPPGGIQWQAGGMPLPGFPLGGHLHFSGIPLTGELLRTLDNYLALPVALLEDRKSFRRRPGYGFLGDFRRKEHGGFEYRTLPSFLISPVVTKGVIALARLICENAPRLTGRPLQEDEQFHAFYSGERERLRRAWPKLAGNLALLPGYSGYGKYLGPFIEAIDKGRTWDESADIRRSWRIPVDSGKNPGL